MALPTGTQAPDFTLKTKTAEGLKDVRLSDNFGTRQTVLLFFPLAFSVPCTKEMCEVRDSLKDYDNLNATVYGISVDTPFTLEAFAAKEGINFPLLSDFNKDASKAYDVLFPELLGLKGIAKRSAFVINKEGVITFSFSSDDAKLVPDFNAIKSALSAS